jgi:hypothetical protein
MIHPPLLRAAHSLAVLLVSLGVLALATAPRPAAAQDRIVLDDFERHVPGTPPEDGWVYITKRERILTLARVLESGERFHVQTGDDGNRFVRAVTRGEALRFSKRNGEEMNWRIDRFPRLRWRWRLHAWPRNATERDDDRNDVAAAVYVTFGTDWLGRPKSIKYTYSSTLPVGTVVEQGPLKVIVASSAQTGEPGAWTTVERDVRADYRRVFGDDPPNPEVLTLWSDSDSTGGTSEADFDDLAIAAPADAR